MQCNFVMHGWAKDINVSGDPGVSLETNKWGAEHMPWEVDNEQHVGVSLPLEDLVLQWGLYPLVIDAISGAGNEFSI